MSARISRAGLPITVVLMLASSLRLWNLASPPQTIWDESWYVTDANGLLGANGFYGIYPHPPEALLGDTTWQHPPLGKMILVLGVGPIGSSPIGWRLPPAVFGIAGVLLVWFTGRVLWRSEWWSALAALLLTLDGLHIVHSRLATLDIFVTTFISAFFLFLILDRHRTEAGALPLGTRLERTFGGRPRFWTGVAMGAAMATKWSAFFPVVFGTVWAAVWLARRSDPGRQLRTALKAIGGLVSVAAVTYLLAYSLFFIEHGPNLAAFTRLQVDMLEKQVTYSEAQPESSRPETWPLMTHPIVYYAASDDATPHTPRILALGNPVVWWGSLLLIPLFLWVAARARDWRDWVILGFFASSYLPWLLLGRTQFIYYMLPAVPFMCLMIPAALRGLPDKVSRPAGIAAAAAVVVTGFAFVPLWLGLPAPWLPWLQWLPGWRA